MRDLDVTVGQLARDLGGTVVGDGTGRVRGIASLESAGADEVTFAADARHLKHIDRTGAAAVIVPRQVAAGPRPLIQVDDVAAAVAAVLATVGEDEDLPAPGVHPTALVAPDARLGEGVAVGPYAVIGPRAVLGARAVVCAHAVVGPDALVGDETVLFEGTVLQRRCRVGRRCRIGPNAVLGSSGFGYNFAGGRFTRVPHVGAVELGDDVDVGACACIDRGKFGDTTVGAGSKIDNLVQVAHNVRIGRHSVLAGLVGIAGSTVIQDYVVLGGHVGVADNITVGSGVRCAAYSAIASSVPDGAQLLGFPAIDARRQRRAFLLRERLPEMHEKLKQLEKRIQALESANDH